LLEDEEDLGETLQDILTDEGYVVHWVKDGEQAADITFAKKYDLYIFDINVPEISGIELLESLRHSEDDTPTIFISAMIDMETIRKAFKIGAEDYLKKPFFPEELLVRIESKFHQKSRDIIYGNLTYNLEKKLLKRNDEEIFLSKKQQLLFNIFITNIDKTLEVQYLMQACSIVSIEALRVAINKLKQLTGIEIRTQHGVGYRLETR